MKRFLTVATFLTLAVFNQGAAEEAMNCRVATDGQSVVVTISTPHADKLLLTTPDGRRIYLRDSDTPTRFPDVEDFINMGELVLDGKTQGTWFNDWGETEIAAALGQSGEYELFVSNDLESSRGKSPTNSCTFSIE